MANFKGHLAAGAGLGAAYGAWGALHLQIPAGTALLGAGMTALGGLLPDLDSDSGVPVRELFNLSGALVPMLLLSRLNQERLSTDQILVVLAGVYLFVRFGLASIFRQLTVHRGMFHSIPAMLIAGLAVFLLYHNANVNYRAYLAGGTMLGFLSHLVLDELFAVDFMGLRPKLNRFAGSALKLWSRSLVATTVTYIILVVMAGCAWVTWSER
jgi:membrane-bound metal-dependent hydrolase YbcI (DUF457 family)